MVQRSGLQTRFTAVPPTERKKYRGNQLNMFTRQMAIERRTCAKGKEEYSKNKIFVEFSVHKLVNKYMKTMIP